MDIIQLSNKYINTLYLKSKDNLGNGCNEKIIAKLIGLDNIQASNVMEYLASKGLIDTESGYGGNIKLRSEGIEYVIGLRKNKIFKTIKFKSVNYLTSTRDAIEFLFKYDIIDENSISETKTIKVSISGGLSIGWGFQIWSAEPNKDYQSLMKMLLQIGKDKIIEKLKEGTLTDHEELMLLTSTHSATAPYDPKNLIELKDAEYEVEIGQKILSEEIKENKLAASIIEIRDIINSIFHDQHHEKLLLLNEERNLLDFFKTAKTQEEFSHRLSSLGQVARYLNGSKLRSITKETDTQIGSITLLEKFLTLIGKPNTDVTECLKQIGRIRQGYPVHTDITGVIQGYKYFGLKYPIEDFESAWTVLLTNYLTALKRLYDILADTYLTKEKK